MINQKMLALGSRRSVIRELFEYGKRRKAEIGEENVFDFSLGNPSVEPPHAVTEELIRLLSEENPLSLHGYTSAQGDASVRAAIAKSINERHGECVSADDIYMTVGAAAALTSTLTAISGAGEEVITLAPYFPEYKVFVEKCGAKLVEVPCERTHFYPDIEKIGRAINEKTAAIIINSPNNPTGAVYPEAVIIELAKLLRSKEKEYKKPIYLIADEPYRELVYDTATVPYLTKYYNDTVVCYSYSKSLSIPGERIGYALVCPRAADARSVYLAICGAARALGYVCAPSLLQRLIPALLSECSDISVYDKNRRLLLEKLTEYGFEVVKPDGAFYLFIKAKEDDAYAFSEVAKQYELILVPSDDFGVPSYVRISYCVKTEQIERALPAFAALAEHYRKENK